MAAVTPIAAELYSYLCGCENGGPLDGGDQSHVESAGPGLPVDVDKRLRRAGIAPHLSRPLSLLPHLHKVSGCGQGAAEST